MMEYTASTHVGQISDVYDDLHGDMVVVEPIVASLAELADGGPALEPKIGTGRIALPLKDKGVEVYGIRR